MARLPQDLGILISGLIARRGNAIHIADSRLHLASMEQLEHERWERHEVHRLSAADIGETEREAIIRARRGQGKFRDNVARVEHACRVTGISNPSYLIASHIKPWRHAANHERLSSNNGLLLAPHADFLFDRGFISFKDGRVVISEVADPRSLLKLGVDPDRPIEVGSFNDEQELFLEFHRREIFRNAI